MEGVPTYLCFISSLTTPDQRFQLIGADLQAALLLLRHGEGCADVCALPVIILLQLIKERGAAFPVAYGTIMRPTDAEHSCWRLLHLVTGLQRF